MIKAMLVDDEEIALDVLEILLKEEGPITVVGRFQQVGEAIEALPRLQPDIVFLDIEMPGMNGLAAASEMNSRYAGAEIVFVTAYQEYALDAFDVHAFAYLLKPVSPDKLARTIARYRQERKKTFISTVRSSPSSAESLAEKRQQSFYLRVLSSMELYDPAKKLITWRTKKTKELFAYLWHHAGEPVYRYRILDDLWPDLPPDRAQSLFHTTLYHLRHGLKAAGLPDMVSFGDERYWMRTDCIECDAVLFSAALETKQPIYQETLALYRGDYLETEHYPWAEAHRLELRAAFIRYLEAVADDQAGVARETVLRKLIELQPYAEQHYHHLIAHLKASGDVAQASNLSKQLEHMQTELMESDPGRA